MTLSVFLLLLLVIFNILRWFGIDYKWVKGRTVKGGTKKRKDRISDVDDTD